MSVLFGKTNVASVRLLNRAGYEVVTPPEQGCCGALYAHSGQLELARACARHHIEVFEKHNLSSIVINAAGCGSTLKEYGQLLRDDPKWAERARQFSAKVKDLTEMLAESAQPAPRTTHMPRMPTTMPAISRTRSTSPNNHGNSFARSSATALWNCPNPMSAAAARAAII